MSKPLIKPEQPPGAIVETYEDGGALRNDGVRLTPASQNPWYVLATVAGEQDVMLVDPILKSRNRRFWNGWMCQAMEEGERAELAEKLGLPKEALAPLSGEEKVEINARFKAAFPHSALEEVMPTTHDIADFRSVYFKKEFLLDQYYFGSHAFFHGAHFHGMQGLKVRTSLLMPYSMRRISLVPTSARQSSPGVLVSKAPILRATPISERRISPLRPFFVRRIHRVCQFPRVAFFQECRFPRGTVHRECFVPRGAFHW